MNARTALWAAVILTILIPVSAFAEQQQGRVHLGLGAGTYIGGGAPLDVESRSLLGAVIELENLWLGSAQSMSLMSHLDFDGDSKILAHISTCVGLSFYLRDPERPSRLKGAEFQMSQTPSLNYRLLVYGGLGRQLLDTRLEQGELEAVTEVFVAGGSLQVLWFMGDNWSFFLEPDARYVLGTGKFELSGQIIVARIGAEIGL